MGCNKSNLSSSRSQSKSLEDDTHISMTGLHTDEINQIGRILKGEKFIESEVLIDLWWDMLTPKLLNLLENYLLYDSRKKFGYHTSIGLTELGFLLRDLTRGSDEELVNYFMKLYMRRCHDDEICYNDLKQFTRDLILSILRFMKFRKTLQYVMWTSRGCTLDLGTVNKWVELSMTCIKKNAEWEYIRSEDVRVWINFNRPLMGLLSYLVRGLFFLDEQRSDDAEELMPVYPPLPELDMTSHQDISGINFPFLLNIIEIMFMNAQVPPKNRIKWKLFYSFPSHGISFTTFYSAVQNSENTLLVVKGIEDDNIFGGYTSKKWKPGPSFTGDERCFLFQLVPEMKLYFTSGFNDHCMYLNSSQKTLPNGLGMGGQHGYWGLWINGGFDYGSCSKSCSTFKGYEMLSAKETFKLCNLEVWGLDEKYGDEEETEEEGAGGSILTKDATARAMLDMLGKINEGANFLEM